MRVGGYVNSYGSDANSYGAKYGTSNNNNQSCVEKSVQLSRVYLNCKLHFFILSIGGKRSTWQFRHDAVKRDM